MKFGGATDTVLQPFEVMMEQILCGILGAIAPYCLLLSFHPPYDLAIVPRDSGGFVGILCRLVWPLVISSGIGTGIAAYFLGADDVDNALTALAIAAPFLILMLVPGLVAFRQFYDLKNDPSRKRS